MQTYFTFLFLLLLQLFGYAQTVELTFTANNNGEYIPLDSIHIKNLTQGGDTTLFFPDTVLVLDYMTSINNHSTSGDNTFTISQNYPNPFQGTTEFYLVLPKQEFISIIVYDGWGRKVVKYEELLSVGSHTYTFVSGNEWFYLLTVKNNEYSQSIKMLNADAGISPRGNCELVYKGLKKISQYTKSIGSKNNFIFNIGDELKFTVYTVVGDSSIIDIPEDNHTYTFNFEAIDYCYGIQSISDYDGNIYDIVQIDTQCWMAENLKTTTYTSGEPIPNVTDFYNWSNLSSGAYVWWDNNILVKDHYGALYNWYAVEDSNKLCPVGWHIPTYDEWQILIDFVSGTGSPPYSELRSCRQSNSPLGGDCTTNDHPRWSFSYLWGTDDYSFSALPGGYRQENGSYSFLGQQGNWWYSTSNYPDWVWECEIRSGFGGAHWFQRNYSFGASVRCLKD